MEPQHKEQHLVVKSHPILFSAPMIRAIIDGTKTQTRRIVKPMHYPDQLFGEAGKPWWNIGGLNGAENICPYGKPGDRLWVKETFCYVSEGGTLTPAYRADGWTECPADNGKWKPSIFCTRAASRITIEITDVRMERLQDITEEDAIAEGTPDNLEAEQGMEMRDSYAALWNRINGHGSWDLNPWVWVISFTKK